MDAKLLNRLEAIEQRNRKVEADKAWETGVLRRAIIVVLTYVVVVVYLFVTGAQNPFVAAVVPAIGYFLSSLVMRTVKDWWVRHNTSQRAADE